MSAQMSWFYLIIAGLLEVVWAVGLKYTEGFTRFWPSFLTVIAMGASFCLLSASMKQIPLGTAYTVWVGIGAIGAVVCGMIFFNESSDFLKLFFISLILVGIIGIKMTSSV